MLGPVENGPRHKVLAPLRQLPDYRRVVRGEFIAEQEAQESLISWYCLRGGQIKGKIKLSFGFATF